MTERAKHQVREQLMGLGGLHLDLMRAAEHEGAGVQFVDGPSEGWFPYSEIVERAQRSATAFLRAGASPGDRVLLILGNRVEFLDSWFGCSFAELVSVPINTEFRGPILQNLIDSMRPTVAVVESEFLASTIEVLASSTSIKAILSVGERAPSATQLRLEDAIDGLPPTSNDQRPGASVPATIFYTSGTTGTSKGVVYTHRGVAYCGETLSRCYGARSDDVPFSVLPLFHINALLTCLYVSVLSASRCAIASRFSLSRYWDQVAISGATLTSMIGSIPSLLWSEPTSGRDAKNTLRRVQILPSPVSFSEWTARFGFDVMQGYGSTEGSYVIGMLPEWTVPDGAAGRVLPGWEVKLVADDGGEVGPGEIGEILVRPKIPFIGMQGYFGEPQATVDVWQDMWLHMGDYLKRDADGWFWFVGRVRESIRRSGENISELEVEQAAVLYPAVSDCVAYGVQSEFGEQDVAVVVIAAAGHEVDPQAFREYLLTQLPYFAVPRYVAVVEDFPRTLTGKVRKEVVKTLDLATRTADLGRITKATVRAMSEGAGATS